MTGETGASVARSLLIVEDDDILRARLAKAFRKRGFEVEEAGGVEDALRSATDEPPEYAVVDLRLQDRSGLEVVSFLARIDPATVIVVLTGYGSIATALEAMRLGATHYLTKPADVEEILAAFARGETEDGSRLEVDAPESTPSLARVEWEHINRVLADCGGNVSKAARLLGLHRRSLQRKLAKFPPRR
jgi:two-component system response regulator RegA